jgi:putative ABC transport system substrate-binding protein
VRRFAAAFALWLCAIIPAFAQNAENLPIIGILRMNTSDTVEPFASGFKNALAAVGLVDGRNIRLEVRYAEGDVER